MSAHINEHEPNMQAHFKSSIYRLPDIDKEVAQTMPTDSKMAKFLQSYGSWFVLALFIFF